MAKEASPLTKMIRKLLSESPVYTEGKQKDKPKLAYSEALPRLQKLGLKDNQGGDLIDMPELSGTLKTLSDKHKLSDASDLCVSANLRRYEVAEQAIEAEGKNPTKTRVMKHLGWSPRSDKAVERADKVLEEYDWREGILKGLSTINRKGVEEELALRSLYSYQQNGFSVLKYQFGKDKPVSTSRKPKVAALKVHLPPRKHHNPISPNNRPAKKVAKKETAKILSIQEALALVDKVGSIPDIQKKIEKLQSEIKSKQDSVSKLQSEVGSKQAEAAALEGHIETLEGIVRRVQAA